MKKSNEKACLTVFSLRVAGDLMSLGHRLIEMKPDKRYPDRNVFFFLNTEAVKTDLQKLLETKYAK